MGVYVTPTVHPDEHIFVGSNSSQKNFCSSKKYSTQVNWMKTSLHTTKYFHVDGNVITWRKYMTWNYSTSGNVFTWRNVFVISWVKFSPSRKAFCLGWNNSVLLGRKVLSQYDIKLFTYPVVAQHIWPIIRAHRPVSLVSWLGCTGWVKKNVPSDKIWHYCTKSWDKLNPFSGYWSWCTCRFAVQK